MISGPIRPERKGLCAGCTEERHTRRCVRKGREVWLCEECERPRIKVTVTPNATGGPQNGAP